MSTIKVHQGDKEVYDFNMVDTQTKLALATDDVTAATFVLVIGSVTLTRTYGDGITTAVVGGGLQVTVVVPTASTDLIATSVKGSYQLRVTRGTIGPETVAEGSAVPVLKIEG